jgi:hypothetical protein
LFRNFVRLILHPWLRLFLTSFFLNLPGTLSFALDQPIESTPPDPVPTAPLASEPQPETPATLPSVSASSSTPSEPSTAPHSSSPTSYEKADKTHPSETNSSGEKHSEASLSPTQDPDRQVKPPSQLEPRTDASTSQLSIPTRRIKLFSYHDIRPLWGLQFETSMNPFGGKINGGSPVVPNQGSTPTYAFDLAFEIQPRFLQSIGILGLGPRIGIYPIFEGGVTSSITSIYSLGGQIRYQARFFRRQFIVPMVAYSIENFNYRFTQGAGNIAAYTGSFWAQGPIWGAWILLNSLDPGASADFYIDNGVARTYLVFESRILSATDPVVKFAGASYYLGLRFEF